MTRKSIWLVLFLSGALIGIFVSIFFLCLPKHVLFTNEVSDYDTEAFPIGDALFPETFPSEAQVVNFSYYDYWYEDTDIYLELKFNSVEALDTFLQECIHRVEKAYGNRHGGNTYSSPIAKQQNPYDDSFVDMFSLIGYIAEGGKRYVGYEIQTSEPAVYNCHYSLLSYSRDHLTVILSSCSGQFVAAENEYTPQYFRRFNIAPSSENNRWIFLNPKT